MPADGRSTVAARLYYDDPSLEFEAVVTEIQLVAQERGPAGEKVQLWRVALDRTAFYPESGGQPWDTGRLTATARSGARLEVAVERVEEDEDGQVWHFVRKPLLQDTVVHGEVNAERRLDHMQQHTGQHLLSAVCLSGWGFGTGSFHLGAEVSTIDLTGFARSAEVPFDLAAIETAVNLLVAADRPVRVHTRSPEDAEAMLARGELRKLPQRAGPLRVVEIEGVEWNACGGTHVRSTAAIGCVLLRRLEKVRQGVRVEFVCGVRAVRRSRAEFEALQQGAQRLGTGWTETAERIEALLVQQKSMGKRLAGMELELARAVTQELLRGGAEGVLSGIYPERGAGFVQEVARGLSLAGRRAVIGASLGGDAWVAVSVGQTASSHAGNLVKAAAAEIGGRGGGQASLGQATCLAEHLPQLVRRLVSDLERKSALD